MQCAKQVLVVVNFLQAQQLQPILHQWLPSKEFLSFFKLFLLIFLTETRCQLSSSPVNYTISPGFNSWPETQLIKQVFFISYSSIYQNSPRGVTNWVKIVYCHTPFNSLSSHHWTLYPTSLICIKPMGDVHVNITDYSVFITI